MLFMLDGQSCSDFDEQACQHQRLVGCLAIGITQRCFTAYARQAKLGLPMRALMRCAV